MKPIITLSFLLFFLFLLALKAHAASVAFGVSPVITEIQAPNPNILDTFIRIKNNSIKPLSLQLRVEPFKKNTDGNIVVLKNPSEAEKKLILGIQFISTSKLIHELKLEPGENKKVEVIIPLDASIPYGDYYLMISFISNQSRSYNQTASNTYIGIASLILLTYGKQEASRIEISSFKTAYVFFHGPVKLEAEVKNDSTSYQKVRGELIVKNMFGETVYKQIIGAKTILGKSKASLSPDHKEALIWPVKYLFGYYTATLVIYGENIEQQKQYVSFFGFPGMIFFGFIFALILILGILLRIKKKLS